MNILFVRQQVKRRLHCRLVLFYLTWTDSTTLNNSETTEGLRSHNGFHAHVCVCEIHTQSLLNIAHFLFKNCCHWTSTDGFVMKRHRTLL